MEIILIKASQLILSLSILVVLHELGHFIPARLFKTRVEKFYLFFNPWFSLYKKKVGETEYGIGWLPLGGYVKISGMIDESMDKDQLKKEPEKWEFRAKPAWQRLIIMVGGVVVNFLLAILIYILVLFFWGENQLSPKNTAEKGGLHVAEMFKSYGFKDGDIITHKDGKKVENILKINRDLLLGNYRSLRVESSKGFNTRTIVLPDDIDEKMFQNGAMQAFFPIIPCAVDSLYENFPAINSGFKKNDLIVSVNGTSITSYQQFNIVIAEIIEDEGESFNADFLISRNNSIVSLKNVQRSVDGFGFAVNANVEDHYEFTLKEYSFLSAIPAGISSGFTTLFDYVAQFKFVFSKKGAESLGGFTAIGNIFPDTWNWKRFWELTAFLSIMLAFLNLLPIPALDGGHVMFLLYEMFAGKPAPEKVLEKAQVIGMILLLLLVIFANGNDFGLWDWLF